MTADLLLFFGGAPTRDWAIFIVTVASERKASMALHTEMERSEEEIRHDEVIRGISEEARRSLLREKLSALVPLPHKPLHMLQLSGTFPKLTMAPRDHLNDPTPEERAFYRTSVACESVHELCILTAGQSSCPR
ncbi:hypothetical protein HPB52_025613 [Rhipicephalus sanguineus]|uniref:Uncharacterized protein n=1 Tax=Rhipicephalus sanguineus TaxID=34632 RepID=A0A9D4PAD4_RHISA|nr:hypothetical protein HPB52_025613 [Rhipicephalus sanguineus]